MILLHNIKAMLPCDAIITGSQEESPVILPQPHTLLTKMHLTISKIQDSFCREETAPSARKRNREDRATGTLNNRWTESEYMEWRRDIHSLWLEMESLVRRG